MCGRVTVRATAEEIQQQFGLNLVLAKLERPRFNLAPSQELPVVINDGRRELDLYRWGLIPSWAKDPKLGNKLSNARAETLAQKPSFRTALKRRRCLIIIDGFYEWLREGKVKRPHFFRRRDGKPFALAGLWEEWRPPDSPEVVRSCTIITTGPNALMAQIHDRMPVILAPETFATWLTPAELDAARLAPLWVPASPEDFERYEVSTVVNNARNEVPACVDPLVPAGAPAA